MQSNRIEITPQQLVAEYGDRVFAIVRRMVRSREDSEEITQDVFLKLFRKIGTFENRSSLSTWVFRVAYNAALDFLKQRRQVSVELGENCELVDSPYDREREQRLSELERAIRQLSGQDALLIDLYYWQKLRVEEIASVVGITPENVKVRLYRSRQQLAKSLGDIK